MTHKDNAGSRRIMTSVDFSHSDPTIYVNKDCLACLAVTVKKFYDIKYTIALNVVASPLCGIKSSFNEFHELHRYDLIYAQAVAEFPDIVGKYIDQLSKDTGLSKPYINFVLESQMCRRYKWTMAEFYESHTGLKACIKARPMITLKFSDDTESLNLLKVLDEIETTLQDDSPWISNNKQDVYLEIQKTIHLIKNGLMKKEKHHRALSWCKEQMTQFLG